MTIRPNHAPRRVAHQMADQFGIKDANKGQIKVVENVFQIVCSLGMPDRYLRRLDQFGYRQNAVFGRPNGRTHPTFRSRLTT